MVVNIILWILNKLFPIRAKQESSQPVADALPSSVDDRLKAVVCAAKAVYSDNTIMAQLAVCQAVLESRLLGIPSQLDDKYNNYFGIKSAGTAGFVTLPTKEYIDGKWMAVQANFGQNSTLADSFKQHRQLMLHTRYAAVWKCTSLAEAASAVHDAGYATDPYYAKSLTDLWNDHIKHYF